MQQFYILTLGLLFASKAAYATTSTSVSCSPTTVVVNQGTTCTATVTDTDNSLAGADPSGTVSFSLDAGSGSFSGSPCTLTGIGGGQSQCQATYTPDRGAVSTHTARATYVPGADTASLGTTNVTVNLRSTTTDVSCSPSSVFINQGSTCTITVTDTAAGTALTPSGTVTLTSSQTGDTGHNGTCSLSGGGGSASCDVTLTPQSPAGARNVGASFPASSNHAASSDGSPFSLTANLRTTTTSVSCASPVVVNQGSTCTATVTDTATGTASSPTGTVSFTNTGSQGSGAFSSGSCTLSSSGANTAQCSVTYTPSTANSAGGGASGSHSVQANYGGSTVHATSNGSTSITVNARDVKTEISCAFDFAPNYVRAGNGKSCTG